MLNADPIAHDDGFVLTQDQAASFSEAELLQNDTDADSDFLEVVGLHGRPKHGSLTWTSSGNFLYTPEAGFIGGDSFQYDISDGTTESRATVRIEIGPLVVMQGTNGSELQTNEETPLEMRLTRDHVGGLAAPYFQVESQSGTLYLLNGTTLAAGEFVSAQSLMDGFCFTPDQDFSGTASFSLHGATAPNTSALVGDSLSFSVNVLPDNDAPIAYDLSQPIQEDEPGSGNVWADDVDSASLTYHLAYGPGMGTVDFYSNGSFTYTPGQDHNGTDSFMFYASDGYHNSNYGTVYINVNPVNDPPAGIYDSLSYTTSEDTELQIPLADLAANATDFDGDYLSYIVSQPPLYGIATLNGDGSFMYQPYPDLNGLDSFQYQIYDGTVYSDPITVFITITPVNDPPASISDSLSYATPEDTELPIALTDLAANATDIDGDTLTYVVSWPPMNGTVLQANDGSFLYQPTTDFNGIDSFQYQIYDGNNYSSPITVTITVTPVDDDPVADPGYNTTDEDTAVTGTLSATDPNGDPLTYVIYSQPTYGSVSLDPATGAYTYTPSYDFNGTDSFAFYASDGVHTSAVTTVNITVNPVDDDPVADPGYNTTDEDTAVNGTLSATDPNGDPLTYAISAPPTYGTVVITDPTTGAYTYTPSYDFHGADSFTFTASDGVHVSAAATVTITVSSVDDDPVADPGYNMTDEDTAVNGILTATDPNGDSLTYAISAPPTYGSVSLDPATGAYTYTPNYDFHGTDSFTFTASDGVHFSAAATVTITVAPVDDDPVADLGYNTTNEDEAVTGTVTATDPNGDPLTYAMDSYPINGTITLDATTGAYTYTPNLDFNGVDSFTFYASDGLHTSAVTTVTITVNAVDDDPIAEPGYNTTDEDTAVTGMLTATDPNGDSLMYAIDVYPTSGTITLDAATGAYTYTPYAEFNGTDSFTFTAADGAHTSAAVTVTITVNAVNDLPVSTDLLESVNEDETLNSSVSATDIENDTLTYQVVNPPQNGTLTLNENGTYSYAPNANFNGTDWFTYVAFDGTGYSDEKTVTITVNAVDDPPVITEFSVEQSYYDPLIWLIFGQVTGDYVAGAEITFGGCLDGYSVTAAGDGSFSTYRTLENPQAAATAIATDSQNNQSPEVSCTIRFTS